MADVINPETGERRFSVHTPDYVGWVIIDREYLTLFGSPPEHCDIVPHEVTDHKTRIVNGVIEHYTEKRTILRAVHSPTKEAAAEDAKAAAAASAKAEAEAQARLRKLADKVDKDGNVLQRQ